VIDNFILRAKPTIRKGNLGIVRFNDAKCRTFADIRAVMLRARELAAHGWRARGVREYNLAPEKIQRPRRRENTVRSSDFAVPLSAAAKLEKAGDIESTLRKIPAVAA
jgi:hypothetical protein